MAIFITLDPLHHILLVGLNPSSLLPFPPVLGLEVVRFR